MMNSIVRNLIEITVSSSIMILIVLSVKAVFGNKVHGKMMSFLWLLVLARLLVPVTLESPVHFDSFLPQEEAGGFDESVSHIPQNTLDHYTGADTLTPIDTGSHTTPTVPVNADLTFVPSPTMIQRCITYMKGISVWTYVFVLWLLGACIVLLNSACKMIAFRRKVIRCRQTGDLRLRKLLYTNKRKLGIRRCVRVVTAGYIEIPITFGLLRPVILIPKAFLHTMDSQKIRLFIMHELCHIKRNDILKSYFWLMARTVHWFNPLVVFAFNTYKDDMELACDEMVVRNTNADGKFVYTQSLLDVVKLSKYNVKAPLAIAFCKNKSKLKERVMNMLKPQKKTKIAGLISLLVAFMMSIACFTTACQPTPESDIVQNKSDDELMDAINVDDTEASVSATASGDDSSVAQYETIDHVSFDLEIAANGTKLNADADVTVPDSVNMPVASYKRKDFTEGFVDGIFDALLGESPFYERSEARSKSEIQDLIVEINYEYHDLDSPMAIEKGITDIEELHSLRDEALQHLYKELETAPDEVPLVEIAKELFDEGYVRGQTPLNDDQMMELRMTNTEYGKEVEMNDSIGVTYSLIGKDGYNTIGNTLQYIMSNGEIVSSISTTDGPFIYPADTQSETMTTTPEQATEIAEEAFHDMGAGDDVQVSDIYYVEIPRSDNFDEIYCYGVVLKRYIGGMPIEIESSSNKGMEQTDNSDQFNAGVPSEMMMAFISDEGIIHLRWSAPIEVVEVLNQNVELAATDEVIEVFKQEFKNAYSDYTDEDVVFSLYDIKLNYGIARIQDENELYMAIPLWEFYASRPVAFYDEDGNPREELQYYDLITINAIDKSRFSREWGY